MTKLLGLFPTPRGETAQAIRSQVVAEKMVVRLLIERRRTIPWIAKRCKCSVDYVLQTANAYDISVKRPSDNWVGRP